MGQRAGTITVDGSYLEGGGQIVRTAIGLSAATGIPCAVTNIRKGRRKPGLAAQHLAGLRAVAAVCGAELLGDRVGSLEIQLRPSHLEPPPRISVEVGTAGAVTLVLQALMIPLACAGREVTIEVSGGTHVKWAPTMNYFQRTLSFFLERMNVSVEAETGAYGFYPKGGGVARVRVRPAALKPIVLTERGAFLRIEASSIASEGLKEARVAERQIEGARELVSIEAEQVGYVNSKSVGTALYLEACFENCRLGASAVGQKGTPAEVVGRQCAELLGRQLDSGACLDRFMADQILPYMALAPGDSCVRVAEITDHCRTSMWVIEKFLPVRFEVDPDRSTIACIQ